MFCDVVLRLETKTWRVSQDRVVQVVAQKQVVPAKAPNDSMRLVRGMRLVCGDEGRPPSMPTAEGWGSGNGCGRLIGIRISVDGACVRR